ncbi:acyltransferase domain-containing protein [Shouchella lehensis]|uniref:Acyltransferase domain-containing protein n=1 Tax=Shouchella lehensis TaxID=300825 RepID=A0A4Y7WLF0_9BACI|nr:acyltransferase domain-containing protein [Shouchella lehensis]MBG9783228.1 hypothetical protein [Shouchella lehensis]TES49398.1 acyltransferase domain-containing protein [Shouchella lehensis]
MKNKTVFLFPGQGSQYPQMAKSLFLNDPYFADTFTLLDRYVSDIAGLSIVDLLYRSENSFHTNRLLHTHLAIYMVQVSLSQSLIQHGVRPDKVIGTSLGEFAAATTAGILPFREAIESLYQQATIIEARSIPGAMLAVLAPPSTFYKTSLNNVFQHCNLAGIHYHSNFLLSMPITERQTVLRALSNLNIPCFPLPVEYPFHSSYMEPLKDAFLSVFNAMRLHKGHTDYIPSSSLFPGIAVTRPDFWRTIREPIFFEETIHRLTEEHQKWIFVDIGPSQTLVNFVKQILPAHKETYGILTPSQQDMTKFNKLVSLYANSDCFL